MLCYHLFSNSCTFVTLPQLSATCNTSRLQFLLAFNASSFSSELSVYDEYFTICTLKLLFPSRKQFKGSWIPGHIHGSFHIGLGVVWWLVNVAVSEMSILRMCASGQVAININPTASAARIFLGPLPTLSVRPIRYDLSSQRWQSRQACASWQISSPVSEQWDISLCGPESRQPSHFMCDFTDSEISALQASFPGVKVYLVTSTENKHGKGGWKIKNMEYQLKRLMNFSKFFEHVHGHLQQKNMRNYHLIITTRKQFKSSKKVMHGLTILRWKHGYSASGYQIHRYISLSYTHACNIHWCTHMHTCTCTHTHTADTHTHTLMYTI